MWGGVRGSTFQASHHYKGTGPAGLPVWAPAELLQQIYGEKQSRLSGLLDFLDFWTFWTFRNFWTFRTFGRGGERRGKLVKFPGSRPTRTTLPELNILIPLLLVSKTIYCSNLLIFTALYMYICKLLQSFVFFKMHLQRKIHFVGKRNKKR